MAARPMTPKIFGLDLRCCPFRLVLEPQTKQKVPRHRLTAVAEKTKRAPQTVAGTGLLQVARMLQVLEMEETKAREPSVP